MRVKGNVESVYSQTKNTRAGDKTIWYGEVDDGNTVNLGFKPIWEEGEFVNVNVEEKFGELQIVRGGKSAPKAPASGPRPSGSGTKRPAGGSGGGFPIDPTNSQVSIIRQSSLNRAVETVQELVACSLFVPETEEDYMNKIWELAYEYTDFGTGQREVKAAAHKEIQRAALEAVNG